MPSKIETHSKGKYCLKQLKPLKPINFSVLQRRIEDLITHQ